MARAFGHTPTPTGVLTTHKPCVLPSRDVSPHCRAIQYHALLWHTSPSAAYQDHPTYGSIGYDVHATSDMSEFTIDQTGSRTRTITSICHPSPAKQPSQELVTAEGSFRIQFDSIQQCSEPEFQTVTICPPSADDDAKKCKYLLLEEVISTQEQTSEPWAIVLSSPVGQHVSTLCSPSTVSFGPKPDVYELLPPPFECTSVTHSPEALTAYTPEAEESEILEFSPPPSQCRSSMHSPSMISIEPDTSSLVTPTASESHLPSIHPPTVSSCCSFSISPVRTLSTLTSSPSLSMLIERVTESREPTAQEVPTEHSLSLALYTSPQQISEYMPSPSECTPTEWPSTVYPPSEPAEHESPCVCHPSTPPSPSHLCEYHPLFLRSLRS
ncbi:hypothetical protein FRC11_008259 [Ceratobasidium sp. 423]|nr:hypothetical protein FRC11_008259 [Ceratobasidium sp. 423]